MKGEVTQTRRGAERKQIRENVGAISLCMSVCVPREGVGLYLGGRIWMNPLIEKPG